MPTTPKQQGKADFGSNEPPGHGFGYHQKSQQPAAYLEEVACQLPDKQMFHGQELRRKQQTDDKETQEIHQRKAAQQAGNNHFVRTEDLRT